MRSLLFLLAVSALAGCRGGSVSIHEPDPSAEPQGPRARRVGADPGHVGRGTPLAPRAGNELAVFAAGCFWGVEETFRQVPGVIATAVGYTGGHTEDPTYESVCTHTTGHAETVLVEFDPKVVSYATLLNVFFKNHDPTTKDRQGPDIGDQYRSAVFTLSSAQAQLAVAAREREASLLGRAVMTVVEPLGRFWKAEEYHQQYDEKTGTRSCPLPKGLPEGT